jgi:diaminohydroxyphosphoribosylaminopyrimidine deaminase/5-amino-6-(5-phosphoribosylamino)uracil reductase
MRHAISLSLKGEGKTGSNPIVGAVIVDSNNQIISEGFHAAGEHAEVVAINAAKVIPIDSTIIVTLEPCNHTGKTGPCTEAIIQAGIKRVVFAVSDPNPIASGGAEALRRAGIEVISGVLESEARFSNRAWFCVIENKRPMYLWKIATTLDGKTSALDGTSQWITGEDSRKVVSWLRRKSDAILVGTGTLIADNPSLIPHDDLGGPNPFRVVMGNRDIPEGSQVLDSRAELIHIKNHNFDDLNSTLLSHGIKQVLVESGSELGSALVRANLIDEIYLFQAPSLLGAGQSFVENIGITTLEDRKNLELIEVTRVGQDIMIHAKVG